MPEIDPTGWPWQVLALLLVLNLFREPLSKVLVSFFPSLGHWLERQADRKLSREDADRQDELAIMQSMMNLQSQAIQQNERLLDFVMNRMDVRLREIVETIKSEMMEIHRELEAINNRWLAATKQMSNNQNQAHIMTIELSKLVDRLELTNKRLDRMIKAEADG